MKRLGELYFTVKEIEWMSTGGVIVKDGVNYTVSKGTVLYCEDLEHDIWHAFNGIEEA